MLSVDDGKAPASDLRPTFRLVTWNIQMGGGKRRAAQLDYLRALHPDVVALQEVRLSSAGPYRHGLAEMGLPHATCSFDGTMDPAIGQGYRCYGVLLASRWPISPVVGPRLPWPERMVSVRVHPGSSPASGAELHAIHMPDKSKGDGKIESFEAVAHYIAEQPTAPRAVFGDLNSPMAEFADGSMMTFGQYWRTDRSPSRPGSRLDLAERSVLGAGGRLTDAVRATHRHEAPNHTWIHRRKGADTGFRLDHLLTEAIDVAAVAYRHEVRQLGLSDHSLLYADLRIISRP